MNEWRYAPAPRTDVVTIPVLWLAIVLSLLVHVSALLLLWPRLQMRNLSDVADLPQQNSSLAVQLAPPATANRDATAAPAPAPSPPVVASVEPQRQLQPRRPTRPTPPPPVTRPPVIAAPRPAPDMPAERPPVVTPPAPPPQAQPTPPTPMPPAPAQDLASYIESRRLARGAPPSFPSNGAQGQGSEDENQRINRIIAANIGLDKPKTFGYDPKSAGGIFQIDHIDYSNAEFYFFGMDKDIGRNAKQLIEVRKGDNPDIYIAIVRRMIEIIREHEKGDFVWLSSRSGREAHLSARPEDNAALEQFIMRDVFPDVRGGR
jgi:outer membrane biosynthesis protein TonB